MTDRPTHDPDELLGALADALADTSGRSADAPASGDDARLAAAVAAAFGAAIEPGVGEVDALLAEAGEDAHPLPPPELPADYVLGAEIGRGGMGVVYRAEQRSLERTVAVKVLRPGDLLFGNAIRRFTQEARLLAKLRHRHIVAIHEVGHVRGQVYYTMDLIEGSDLSRVLQDGVLTPAHAVRLMRQVTSAIAYTHAHGLIHRDLKPANILVDADGDACVTDFGLAMELGGGDQLTVTGQILGTPAYMSPEQARGDGGSVGEATDVWALGALLYECLTGRVPFERSSPVEQIHAVIHDEPVRPRKVRLAVPEDLETICLKALEKLPEDRYPTARAFLEDLERWESGLPIRAVAASPAQRLARWVTRNRAPVLSAAAASLLAFLVFAFGVLPFVRQDRVTLSRTADEMLAAGEYDAAASLYAALVEQAGGDRVDDELLTRLVEARVAVARDLADAGRTDDAAALLAETRDVGLVGRDPALWVDGALLAYERDVVAGQGTATSLRALVDAVQKAQVAARVGGGAIDHVSPFDGAAELVVSRLAGDDVGPASARRRLVRTHLHALSRSQPSCWPAVERWVRDDPNRSFDRMLVASEAVFGPGSTASVHALGGLQATCMDVLVPATHAELARRASGEGADALGSRVAAHLLAWAADLPVGLKFRPASHEDMARTAFDPSVVVEAWEAVQGLDAIDGWHRRVALCLDETAHAARWPNEIDGQERRALAPRTDLQDLRDWFSMHVGVPLGDTYASFPEHADEWRSRLADTDPRDTLAAAIGLDARPSAEDAPQLVGLMSRRTELAPWIHHLLTLTLPPESAPRLMTTYGAHAIERGWRRALVGATPTVYRVRTARAEFSEGTWRLVPGTDDLRDVEVGERIGLAWEHAGAAATRMEFGFHVPGTVRTPASLGIVHATLEFEFDPANAALGIEVTDDAPTARGFVFSPDHRLGSWSLPDQGRNTLVLAVIESRAGPDEPWTLDDWRDAVASDTRRLAELATSSQPAYEFHNRYQSALRETCTVATHLPVPASLPWLRGLSRCATGWQSRLSAECVLLARLVAGDAAVVHDPYVTAGLADGFDSTLDGTLGPGGKYWARLLMISDDAEIRGLAAKGLAGDLSSDVAGDLVAAHDGGAVVLPPVIEALVSRLAPSSNPWAAAFDVRPGPTFLAVFFTLLAIATLTAVALLRGPNRVILSAALVLVGLLLLSAHVSIGGMDLVPDALGAALAAIGVALLRKHAPGRAARVACGAFAVAAVLFALPIDAAGTLAGLAVLTGVTALVVLARDLTPPQSNVSQSAPRRPARASGVHLFVGTLVAVVVAAMLGAALSGGGVFLSATLLLAFIALPAGIVLQGLRPIPRGRAHLRALPIPFVICYVVPLALGYVVAVLHRSAGLDLTVQLDDGLAAGLIVVLALSVAWVAQRLFGAARARAAALRQDEAAASQGVADGGGVGDGAGGPRRFRR